VAVYYSCHVGGNSKLGGRPRGNGLRILTYVLKQATIWPSHAHYRLLLYCLAQCHRNISAGVAKRGGGDAAAATAAAYLQLWRRKQRYVA